jgi:hypothetical protein
MDVGGTSPGMGEGTRLWMVEDRTMQELLSRTMQRAIDESEARLQGGRR